MKMEIMAPKEARTDSSIALLWNKVEEACGYQQPSLAYEIYVDGIKVKETTATDDTLVNLTPDTAYQVQVKVKAPEGQVYESQVLTVRTELPSRRYDITEFGAVGDGKTVNTKAVQQAISACEKGGTVYIPKGVFRCGALYLKSDMTLYLEEGAVLLGSDAISDFPLMNYRFEGLETRCYASLINVPEELPGEKSTEIRYQNIKICGKGTIDGNGSVLRRQELDENKGKPGRTVCIRNTRGVYFYGVTFRQCPAWCVHTIYCEEVSLNQVEIHSKYAADGSRYEGILNGDGFDPDSCRNVRVFHSLIASQDDCIAIKSGRDAEGRSVAVPSENIRITNCRFLSGFGVCVGSEMSGSVRNMLVQDCVFEDVYSVGSVKAPRGRGGEIVNVLYENCTHFYRSGEHTDCRWFRGAINVDMFYSHEESEIGDIEQINEGTSLIRNVSFRNIRINTIAGNAIFICGLPERHLQNITLENIEAAGNYGMKINYVDGLCCSNINVGAEIL